MGAPQFHPLDIDQALTLAGVLLECTDWERDSGFPSQPESLAATLYSSPSQLPPPQFAASGHTRRLSHLGNHSIVNWSEGRQSGMYVMCQQRSFSDVVFARNSRWSGTYCTATACTSLPDMPHFGVAIPSWTGSCSLRSRRQAFTADSRARRALHLLTTCDSTLVPQQPSVPGGPVCGAGQRRHRSVRRGRVRRLQ
jgi:hypothetical protein